MGTSTRRSRPPIIRLGHPLAFAAFLEHIGAPAERHLNHNGLALYSDNPDEFVPLPGAWSFFDDAAQREEPMLGWYVGRFVGDHNLNHKLLSTLENSTSLYEALKGLVRRRGSEASDVQLGILERRDDILLTTEYPNMKSVRGYQLSQAYQIGLLVDLIRQFAGPFWEPREIGIEDANASRVAEEHFPGSRILPKRRRGYIVVPRSRLYGSVRDKDPGDAREDSFVATEDFDYADTLGALLKPYLPGGHPSARLAASLMDTSVRTLARRLRDCGVTYQAVIDRARFDKAKKLLRDTELRITDVAIAVGFDDSANFARMFRRIGGLSPKQFRREDRSL